MDVYNQKGKYLGDLLPVLDPFGRLKKLHPHHWCYLYDNGVVESQLRFRLDNVRVLQDPKRVRVIPGHEFLLLRPDEIYIFQLVADERLLSTPSVIDRFERGTMDENAWQNNSARHKVVIRSNAIKFKMPSSTNAKSLRQGKANKVLRALFN
ncbi:MAG: hypothetical protein CMJ78_16725 [Planctomycetaceae bacterium]|nr:hypothetical protein [Planctomycetaceae bacterium]